jgi:hypothetical protein
MKNVPSTNSTYVVGYRSPAVRACHARDEGLKEDGAGGCTLVLWDLFLITEDVIGEEARAVRFTCGFGPCKRHNIHDSVQISFREVYLLTLMVSWLA